MTEANQFTLFDVIQFLDHVQEITTDDIATIHKEIVSPNGIHDNEKSQVHLQMLLAEALNEVASLKIVIAKLKSGDIGIWLEHNGKQFLKITDRKKELFKTAGGKYIAPQVIENKMKECPFLEQMMVVGGDDKKFIAALIVPSFMQLSAWAKEQELTFNSNIELIALPKTIGFMEQEVEKINPNFGHWEQIKKIKLLPQEWSVETGELTPTMKPKRKVIYEKYAKEIEGIFSTSSI